MREGKHRSALPNTLDLKAIRLYLYRKSFVMSIPFQSSKKCPECREWSDWNQQITDTCQHCGALLSGQEFLHAAAREAEQQENKGFGIGLIPIHPTDAWPVVVLKRLVQAIQISFVAIVSFIIWFLTMLAG
jgi:hypothetical protein